MGIIYVVKVHEPPLEGGKVKTETRVSEESFTGCPERPGERQAKPNEESEGSHSQRCCLNESESL